MVLLRDVEVRCVAEDRSEVQLHFRIFEVQHSSKMVRLWYCIKYHHVISFKLMSLILAKYQEYIGSYQRIYILQLCWRLNLFQQSITNFIIAFMKDVLFGLFLELGGEMASSIILDCLLIDQCSHRVKVLLPSIIFFVDV